jgi:DNA-binding transcriptional MerR regulator
MGNIYLIKDLSRHSGFSIYTIKYYLQLGLIQEAGRFPETNFRYFDDKNLKALQKIHQLRKEKKSLRQIGDILNGGDGQQ